MDESSKYLGWTAFQAEAYTSSGVFAILTISGNSGSATMYPEIQRTDSIVKTS